MKYNLIKGDKISALGFGTMRYPVIDGDNAKIDEDKAEALLLEAIDKGINYLDTAYNYHGRQSEPYLGKFVEKHNLRDKVFLATKLPCWMVNESEDFEKFFYEQMQNLRTDRIDFYLLHSLDLKTFEKVVKLGVFNFLHYIKKRGLVKYVGFSFHDEYPAFEKMLNAYPWDFCQIQYNYMDIDEQAGEKGLRLAEKAGIPVIVMEPLKGGRLSNLNDEAKLLLDDKNGLSPSQAALKFVMSEPNVLTTLSGMNAHEQLGENIEIADLDDKKLSESEIKGFEAVRKYLKRREKIGCTECEYCMPCPADVKIPTVFSQWNNAAVYDEWEKQKKAYLKLKSEGNGADKCVECGHCEEMCPQGLKIIEGLAKADSELG